MFRKVVRKNFWILFQGKTMEIYSSFRVGKLNRIKNLYNESHYTTEEYTEPKNILSLEGLEIVLEENLENSV